MLLIPSIDLRGGRCVRLQRGDFAAETHYPLEPQQLLRRYRALGAEWLHVVDLDGARAGVPAHLELIRSLAEPRLLRLQVGGGVRAEPLIEQLLAGGAERVVIGSAAVEQPAAVSDWLERYGPARLCLAFDVQLDAEGVPRLRTRGWQQQSALSLWQALEQFASAGLEHVLCTDIARDGMLCGPNVALYAEAVRRWPRICWQASGGIGSGQDLAALARSGVAAAISGKALLEDRIEVEELRPFLPNA